MCCPFVGSYSPTTGRESSLMVLLVSGSLSFLACHREMYWVLFCSSLIPVKCLSWWRTDYNYAYAEDSTLLAVVRKEAERPAVAASLNRNLARIQEWCNHWCIILNPNKTKAFVVGRSWTVGLPWWLDIIIIIIKKGRQCKAEREWCTPYQSEDTSHTIPTYRQK